MNAEFEVRWINYVPRSPDWFNSVFLFGVRSTFSSLRSERFGELHVVTDAERADNHSFDFDSSGWTFSSSLHKAINERELAENSFEISCFLLGHLCLGSSASEQVQSRKSHFETGICCPSGRQPSQLPLKSRKLNIVQINNKTFSVDPYRDIHIAMCDRNRELGLRTLSHIRNYPNNHQQVGLPQNQIPICFYGPQQAKNNNKSYPNWIQIRVIKESIISYMQMHH